jgi:hypothetical protein
MTARPKSPWSFWKANPSARPSASRVSCLGSALFLDSAACILGNCRRAAELETKSAPPFFTQMGRNKQPHSVTAGYLSGFTSDGNRETQLFVYERNKEGHFKQIPDEAAKRRNYYSVRLPDGTYYDEVDRMLTALENQALPVLKKLIASDYRLEQFERARLAYLIAYQELRTPWARGMLEEMYSVMLEHAMKAPGALERALEEIKRTGSEVGAARAEDVRNALREKRIKMKCSPHVSLAPMATVAPHIGDIYVQMQWVVIKSKNLNFVTSDAPVVRRDRGYKGGFYGGGLFSSTVEVWFPLSRNACILIRPDNERVKLRAELLQKGKAAEARKLRQAIGPIRAIQVRDEVVEAINANTTLYLVFGVGFTLGVILGFCLSHPAVVRAQAESIVHMTYIPTKRKATQSVPGEVIGFSCTANAGVSECYVLSH